MPLVDIRSGSKKQTINSAENQANADSLGQIKDEITF